uniref:Uncharacterized protein n=1 Tax=Rangifer tarandus platyrhynchus TaxID=3082113 RepID=A0ACB0EEP8_RANTA|nr:unnamed protein product [Rangifer tarandus platyrhynchus]
MRAGRSALLAEAAAGGKERRAEQEAKHTSFSLPPGTSLSSLLGESCAKENADLGKVRSGSARKSGKAKSGGGDSHPHIHTRFRLSVSMLGEGRRFRRAHTRDTCSGPCPPPPSRNPGRTGSGTGSCPTPGPQLGSPSSAPVAAAPRQGSRFRGPRRGRGPGRGAWGWGGPMEDAVDITAETARLSRGCSDRSAFAPPPSPQPEPASGQDSGGGLVLLENGFSAVLLSPLLQCRIFALSSCGMGGGEQRDGFVTGSAGLSGNALNAAWPACPFQSDEGTPTGTSWWMGEKTKGKPLSSQIAERVPPPRLGRKFRSARVFKVVAAPGTDCTAVERGGRGER